MAGTTRPTVTGATNDTFRYMVGTNLSLPSTVDDLSAWTVWNGGDVTATDGQQICITEVDENNLAIRAGIAIVIVGI